MPCSPPCSARVGHDDRGGGASVDGRQRGVRVRLLQTRDRRDPGAAERPWRSRRDLGRSRLRCGDRSVPFLCIVHVPGFGSIC